MKRLTIKALKRIFKACVLTAEAYVIASIFRAILKVDSEIIVDNRTDTISIDANGDICVIEGVYDCSLDELVIYLRHKVIDYIWSDAVLVTFETVVHELRHAWQHKYKPEIFDYAVAYFEQPHEKDARKYANKWVRRAKVIGIVLIFVAALIIGYIGRGIL